MKGFVIFLAAFPTLTSDCFNFDYPDYKDSFSCFFQPIKDWIGDAEKERPFERWRPWASPRGSGSSPQPTQPDEWTNSHRGSSTLSMVRLLVKQLDKHLVRVLVNQLNKHLARLLANRLERYFSKNIYL